MKRTILLLMVLATISLTSIASTEVSQQRRGNRNYSTELDLSTEQRTKVGEINREYDKKIEATRNAKMTSNERSEKIRSLRDEKRNAIEKILTAEQKTRFNNNGSRHHRTHNGDDCWSGERTNDSCSSASRSENGCGYGNGEMRESCNQNGHRSDCGMFESLDLTDKQEKQIDALYEKYATGSNSSYEKYRSEMMKVLTSEQQKQYGDNDTTCDHGSNMKNYRRGNKRGGCR